MAELRRLGTLCDVLCLQEVHGLRGEVESSLGESLPMWKVFHTCCKSEDQRNLVGTGGAVMAISPKKLSVCRVKCTVVVPGRCQVSTLRRDRVVVDIYNVHNAGLRRSEVDDICGRFQHNANRDSSSPNTHFSIAIGDFNFMARGEARLQAGRHLGLRALARPVNYSAFQVPFEVPD